MSSDASAVSDARRTYGASRSFASAASGGCSAGESVSSLTATIASDALARAKRSAQSVGLNRSVCRSETTRTIDVRPPDTGPESARAIAGVTLGEPVGTGSRRSPSRRAENSAGPSPLSV